jgi:hypothetical protein
MARPTPLLMHKPWARKRAADEVPTPVAIALADFCRRAGAPAPPADVRDALSVLAPEEDFRVRTLTDGEPPALPLGPYAVVDVLGGTPPGVAAQREGCGYYQLVRGILAAETVPRPAPPESAPEPAPLSPPAAGPPPLATAGELASRLPGPRPSASSPTVAQRIAPKRRPPGSKPASPAAPRGRFAQLPSEQPSLDGLDAQQLTSLLRQHGHRPALLRTLTANRASNVTAHVLDRALERAGLLETAAETERELVLSTLEEQRGALGRAAWALNVRAGELSGWAQRLGIASEVDRIRDRFRREALQPVHWTARLDLLGKRKYLEDLGVTSDFEHSVSEDLRRALETTDGSPEERTALLATRLGVAPEALRRSLLRLGLFPGAPSSTFPQPV